MEGWKVTDKSGGPRELVPLPVPFFLLELFAIINSRGDMKNLLISSKEANYGQYQ